MLGRGFLAHPANGELRHALAACEDAPRRYSRWLQRLAYRLLVLWSAEERGLLHPPGTPVEIQEEYRLHHAALRLLPLAAASGASAPPSGSEAQWRDLARVLAGLASPGGLPALGLPALGGLFAAGRGPLPELTGCALTDAVLYEAVRLLAAAGDARVRGQQGPDAADLVRPGPASRPDPAGRLDVLHQHLLELHPLLELDACRFALQPAAGHERKTGGSYYTPAELVEALCDSALEPLLDEAAARASRREAEQALLGLRVCDPACGSGAFLVAAARRIARRLASLRSSGACAASSEAEQQHRALGEVLQRCIYGVDLDELAVELCQVQLWLEASLPGVQPGSFAGHVRCGNSLLGATPALLARDLGSAAAAAAASWEVADAWCAAQIWPAAARPGDGELPPPPGPELLRRLASDPAAAAAAPPWQRELVRRLAERHRFFHWHLAFPEVFRLPAAAGERPENEQAGWSGGFDAVLGNPPWERIRLLEKEFFATRAPAVSRAANAAERRRLVAELCALQPALARSFQQARDTAEEESRFVRSSGRYPLSGRGDVNVYAPFIEASRQLAHPAGRIGLIVPSGLATDATTRWLMHDLVVSRQLASLYDFENSLPLFPGVHRSYKLCLLTLTGPARPAERGTDFVFFARQLEDLGDERRHVRLGAEEVALLNPNTRTCPVLRSQAAADLACAVYRRVPVLVREGDRPENPWNVSFLRMLDMTCDADLFCPGDTLAAQGWVRQGNVFVHPRGDGRHLPLWEDWMIHHFDHRYQSQGRQATTVQQHQDPGFLAEPRYWALEEAVRARCLSLPEDGYLIGFRNRTRSTDARTVLCSVLPRAAVGNTVPLLVTPLRRHRVLLPAMLSSFALDWLACQKIGGLNLNFFIFKQLPLHPPATFDEPAPWAPHVSLVDWLVPRVLELTCTAWDLLSFARDCGWQGPPFRWDEPRRALLRAELDAAFFHLYGFSRSQVLQVLDDFPIVRRKDIARHGEPRTARLICERYDALALARDRGQAYCTPLDPPPADPRQAHTGPPPDWLAVT